MTTPVKRAGMIGLGAMGLQMARHMARKGFDVAGFDVSAEVMNKAKANGIATLGSSAEVGQNSEVVVIMVATGEQVEEVITGSLLGKLAPGSVICIASSVSPELCQHMNKLAAEQGCGVLDTPVVLGQEAADNGQLVIYTGGEEKWVERAKPALESFGRVMHLGGVGTGQIAKTINNLLLWSCMCANYEALTFAKKIGADIPKLIAALGEGSGANWSLSRWGKSTGKWAEKDMDVALEMAQDAKMPMPLGGLVDQLVKSINQEKMKALLS
jgi:3-hydroxyisobutyrate dehydrogenase-like beta-hydroxyacid dehydrogenase